jgi:hypothetical protein
VAMSCHVLRLLLRRDDTNQTNAGFHQQLRQEQF